MITSHHYYFCRAQVKHICQKPEHPPYIKTYYQWDTATPFTSSVIHRCQNTARSVHTLLWPFHGWYIANSEARLASVTHHSESIGGSVWKVCLPLHVMFKEAIVSTTTTKPINTLASSTRPEFEAHQEPAYMPETCAPTHISNHTTIQKQWHSHPVWPIDVRTLLEV